MKRIYTVLALIAFALNLQAQQSKLEYIHTDDHMGVFKIGSLAGELMRTEPVPGNKVLYVLQAVDADLRVTEKSHVAISTQSRFVNVLSNEKRSVALFQNVNTQETDMVNISASGRLSTHQAYADNPNDLHYWSSVTDARMDEKGFLYVSRTYHVFEDDKKRRYSERGVEVLCFGTEFELKWAKKFKTPSDKVSFVMDQIVPFNGGCVAMISENSRTDKAFTTGLHFINAQGNVLGKYELKKEGDTYYPTSFKVDGSHLIACGMYFDEPWYKAINSAGMFFTKLDASGKEVFLQTQDWKGIDETINSGTSSDFLFSGKMKVLVHDIYKSANGYSVICESYQKASGVTGAELLVGSDDGNNKRSFSIFDFIVFDFDASGKLLKSRKIAKESRNIEVVGNVAYTRGVELSFILRDNFLFSYRYVANNQLVYMNLEDTEPVLYWADLASGKVLKKMPIKIEPEIINEEDPNTREIINNSKTLSGLEKFANKMDQVDKKLEDVGEGIERGISKTDQVFYIGSPKLSGLIYLGNDVNINYLLFPSQSELYLKKM